MAGDYPAIHERVFQRFPMMRSSAFERRMLLQRSGERNSKVSGLKATAPERASIVPNS
jgi:hypothetical protein